MKLSTIAAVALTMAILFFVHDPSQAKIKAKINLKEIEEYDWVADTDTDTVKVNAKTAKIHHGNKEVKEACRMFVKEGKGLSEIMKKLGKENIQSVIDDLLKYSCH